MNIFYIFTKDYRKDSKQLECIKLNLEKFKLKSNHYAIDEAITLLKEEKFENHFHLERNDIERKDIG